jgi:hypothetical protein
VKAEECLVQDARTVDESHMTKLYAGSPTLFERQAQDHGATGDKYIFEHLMLPMKDGVRLATAICRPRAQGRHPVVMERTPYKTNLRFDVYKHVFAAGYAVVVQHERGTQWSEGDFSFLGNTAADALETLAWLEQQEWSNGRVATIGCSSTAENQLVIGATGHSALRAQIAMSSGAGIGNIPGTEGSNGLFYRGGIPMLQVWALWYSPFGFIQRPKLPLSDDPEQTARFMRNYSVESPDYTNGDYNREMVKSTKIAPSRDVLKRLGVPRSGFDRYISAGPSDEVWQEPDFISAEHTGATPGDQHQRMAGRRRLRDRQALRVPAVPPRSIPDHGTDRTLQDDCRGRTPSVSGGQADG